MNFELAEIVPVNDAEKVLQVLELHLRGVAAEVVRSNGQITAYGIGPSPRIVNRRDTTVVAASSVDGVTRLTANVNYQASALLGNSPQNEIVKAKIEAVLNDMRAELKAPKPWVPRMDPEPQPTQPTRELNSQQLPPAKPKKIYSEQNDELFGKLSFEAPATPMFLKRDVISSITEPTIAPFIAASRTSAPVPLEPTPVPSAVRVPLANEPEVISKRKKLPGQKSSATHRVSSGKRPNGSSAAHRIASANVTASDIAARKIIESPPLRGASGQIITAKGSKDLNGDYKGVDRRTGPQAPVLHGRSDGVKPVERRRIAPMIEVPLRGLLRSRGPAIEDAVLAHKWWRIVLAVAATLLLVSGIAGYLMRDRLPEGPWKSAISVWSKQIVRALPGLHETNAVVQADTIPAASAPMPVSAAAPAPASDGTNDLENATDAAALTSPISDDTALTVKPETNIYQWVKDWSAAVQSRDADAQASYYAHTVDHYLTHSRVQQDFIWKDKAAQIGERGPVWTVSFDQVSLQKQSNGGIALRAIKHMVSTNATGDSTETAVQVRLKLVRSEGTWKIVEEQELN